MFGPYGYASCPDCGLSVPASKLREGSHECNQENLIAHQVVRARRELESLEVEVEEYLCTPRAQRLLAFARWCAANGR